jgi:hypothetical protein
MSLARRRGGQVVLEDKLWKYARRYIKWFYHVFHHIMSDPTPVAEYTTLVPPYEEVVVE